ncbi:hypothetical protein BHM03_00059336 [Ensete ventricosum]|nr:hypothetical protein BHM03_00059336 [Ensete ventricosum]
MVRSTYTCAQISCPHQGFRGDSVFLTRQLRNVTRTQRLRRPAWQNVTGDGTWSPRESWGRVGDCEFDLAFLRFAPAAPGFEPDRRKPSARALRPKLWALERRVMAAELGQQTVEFSALVRRAAEDSYLALKELVERSRAPEDQRSDSALTKLSYD